MALCLNTMTAFLLGVLYGAPDLLVAIDDITLIAPAAFFSAFPIVFTAKGL